MKSMTGFGRASRVDEAWETTVQANSVNRKALEVSISMPRAWQWLEPEIGREVRALLHRGRIQVSVECKPIGSAAGLAVDESRLDQVIGQLSDYAARKGIPFEPDAPFLLQLALSARREEGESPTDDELPELVKPVLNEALVALVAMREREGTALAADLTTRGNTLARLVAEITVLSEGAVDSYREMLMQRLSQAGLDLDLSDERVLKEVALFADRCDISEELTRLDSHLSQFADLCRSDQPAGRTMEFVLQEIGREINTVGSKTSRVEASRLVFEFKNELERIREQVQNVE